MLDRILDLDLRVKIIAGLVLFLIGVLLGLVFSNRHYIEFSIQSGDEVTLEYGVDQLPEVTALYKGTIFGKNGKSIEVTESGELDMNTLGTYSVTYVASKGKTDSSVTQIVHVVDTTAPEITLVSDPEHYTSPIAAYAEEGYTATDIHDGDVTENVTSEEKDGYVYYTVTDAAGNVGTAKREIIYKDTVEPVITLTDGDEVKWEAGKDFTDPGYTAADDVDGDITDKVTVTGTVDPKTLGDYELTYTVKDSYDNETVVKRKVTVADMTAPVIELSGDDTVYVKLGESYSDPGYTATDAYDGDVTDKVTVSGSPDTSKAGAYDVTYTAVDAAGNTSTATRTVYVYSGQSQSSVKDPGNKVVYLTFDDGPGPYTEELLDILDKYNVKATFFVTNQFPAYQNMISEEYKRGHTVAIHSYSHNYSQIYTSESAFYDDVEKMAEICRNQTGVTPTILRFPGGTSNTVSASYCTGIMTALSQSCGKMGYQYCDWNVTSGDAGETTNTATIVSNVTSGIADYNISYVLQHDIKDYSVAAVEQIIQWGLANGYTFLPLTDSSPMCHHGINN